MVNNSTKTKNNNFILIGIILFVIFGTCSFFLFSFINKEKESLTSTEFKNIMEDKGYEVVDATNQFEGYNEIQTVYLAVDKNKEYQIEFYDLKAESEAISFYNHNKKIAGSSNNYSEMNLNNYSKYTSSDSNYLVISRINNTVVYVDEDIKHKDVIKSVLKDLGY